MTDINKTSNININNIQSAENKQPNNRVYYKQETSSDSFVSSKKQPSVSFWGRISKFFNKNESTQKPADSSEEISKKQPRYIRLGNKVVDYNTLTDREKYVLSIFQDPNFNYSDYWDNLYAEYREMGVYENADNIIGDPAMLQRFIDGNNDRSLTNSSINLLRRGGWVYRMGNNIINSEDNDRISLNVKGSYSLIAELDHFMCTGEYYAGGKKFKTKNLTPFSYKTPDNISKWGYRVDPVTIYFSGKVNDETLSALSAITFKYKRGNIKYPINNASDWISKDKNINEQDVKYLVKLIRNQYGFEGLARAIEAEAYKYNGVISSGYYFTALSALRDLIDYTKLINQ